MIRPCMEREFCIREEERSELQVRAALMEHTADVSMRVGCLKSHVMPKAHTCSITFQVPRANVQALQGACAELIIGSCSAETGTKFLQHRKVQDRAATGCSGVRLQHVFTMEMAAKPEWKPVSTILINR